VRKVGQHHGELEQALLRHALQRIARGEVLSLRGVAEDAGVSPGAPYHHFATKEALLAAVARDGFVQLEQALAAVDGTLEPRDRLARMCRAYVDFSLQHSAHYRVMWSPALSSGAFPELSGAALACFSRLEEAVRSVRTAAGGGGGGDDDSESVRRASLAWALAHGIVLLSFDGVLGDLATERGVAPTAQGGAAHDDMAEAVLALVCR
jgi:AcrR family transcriptional regulator